MLWQDCVISLKDEDNPIMSWKNIFPITWLLAEHVFSFSAQSQFIFLDAVYYLV